MMADDELAAASQLARDAKASMMPESTIFHSSDTEIFQQMERSRLSSELLLLKNEMNEKEMHILELRSSAMAEAAALRDEVREQRRAVAERDQLVERLQQEIAAARLGGDEVHADVDGAGASPTTSHCTGTELLELDEHMQRQRAGVRALRLQVAQKQKAHNQESASLRAALQKQGHEMAALRKDLAQARAKEQQLRSRPDADVQQGNAPNTGKCAASDGGDSIVATLRARLDEKDELISALRARVGQLTKVANTTSDRVARLQSASYAAEQSRREQRETTKRSETLLRQMQVALDEATEARLQSDAQLQATSAELDATRTTAEATARAVEQLRADVQGERDAVVQANTEVEALRAELDARVVEVQQTKAAQVERERAAVAVVSAAQDEARAAEAHSVALQQQLDARRADMERLQADLQQAELQIRAAPTSIDFDGLGSGPAGGSGGAGSGAPTLAAADKLKLEDTQCELLQSRARERKLEQQLQAATAQQAQREEEWHRERQQILNDVVAGPGPDPREVMTQRLTHQNEMMSTALAALCGARAKASQLSCSCEALGELVVGQLEGRQPNMALLFDDPEERHYRPQRQPPHELSGAEHAGEALREETGAVVGAIERAAAEVSSLRGRIAEHYAENMGSQCATQ